jgi:hypothetical protein
VLPSHSGLELGSLAPKNILSIAIFSFCKQVISKLTLLQALADLIWQYNPEIEISKVNYFCDRVDGKVCLFV